MFQRHSLLTGPALVLVAGLLVMVAGSFQNPGPTRTRMLTDGGLTAAIGLVLGGLLWYLLRRSGLG
jgi:hypothetical protein